MCVCECLSVCVCVSVLTAIIPMAPADRSPKQYAVVTVIVLEWGGPVQCEIFSWGPNSLGLPLTEGLL